MILLMSHDEDVMPDALAGLADSAGFQLSDLPFEYPISEVRVARVDGMFVINPSKKQLLTSDIDIMIGASENSIAMVEGEFNEITEEEMLDAISYGHSAIKDQINAQIALAKEFEKGYKNIRKEVSDNDLKKKIIEETYESFIMLLKRSHKS